MTIGILEYLEKARRVKRPGVRGGRYWIDKRGNIRYDEQPDDERRQAVSLFDITEEPSKAPESVKPIGIRDMIEAKRQVEQQAKVETPTVSRVKGAVVYVVPDRDGYIELAVPKEAITKDLEIKLFKAGFNYHRSPFSLIQTPSEINGKILLRANINREENALPFALQLTGQTEPAEESPFFARFEDVKVGDRVTLVTGPMGYRYSGVVVEKEDTSDRGPGLVLQDENGARTTYRMNTYKIFEHVPATSKEQAKPDDRAIMQRVTEYAKQRAALILGKIRESKNFGPPVVDVNADGVVHIRAELINKDPRFPTMSAQAWSIYEDGQTAGVYEGGKGDPVPPEAFDLAADLPFDVRPEQLDRKAAEDAYRWGSMEPDRRADMEQLEYVKHMQATWEQLVPLAETEEQKKLLIDEMEKYRKQWLFHKHAEMAAHGKIASVLVTGPAKFDYRKNQKAIDTHQRRIEELLDFQRKAREAIKRKLLSSRTPEQVEDAELKRLKEQVLECVATLKGIEMGKMVGFDRQPFVTSLANVLKRSTANGYLDQVKRALDFLKDLEAQHLKKQVFSPRHSIWQYVNSHATYVESQQAKQQTTAGGLQTSGEKTLGTFTGRGMTVEMVSNFDEDRVQLRFTGKPDSEVREALKGSGWHWSPRNGAWQRKLTTNAKYSAQRIMNQFFKPVEE